MRRVSPVRALDVHKANILLLSRGILILLCVLVIILECNALSLDGRRTRAIAIKKWTVMVYQCGDNDLEDALIKDFNEMERVGSTDDVNIVVELGRSPSYDTSNDNWTGVRRYYVIRDPQENPSPEVMPNNIIRSQLIADLGNVNMGTEDALVSFVQWAVKNYPAERYFLILSNHGSGVRPFRRYEALRIPMRAIIFADSFNDFLSNGELKSAFTRIRALLNDQPLEILGYDASEMSMIENAYQVRHGAKYFIASQLSEPNDGYPYDRFLATLTANPNIPTEQFLNEFVQHYITSYEPGRPTNGAGMSVTIAVYRMSAMQPLVDAISNLGSVLKRKLSTLASTIEEIRQATQTFSESIYRDVYHFAQLLVERIDDAEVRRTAQAVMNSVGPGENAALLIEAHRTGIDVNVDNAHGIAIYFPSPNSFESGYLTDLDFGRETQWGQFLAARSVTDTEPPAIRFLFPTSDGLQLPLVRPVIVARVEDRGSAGLDTDSLRVTLDGNQLAPSEYSFDASKHLLHIKPSSALGTGEHAIEITVSDMRGNTSSAQLKFSISIPRLLKGIRMLSLPLQTSVIDPRTVLSDADVITARWDNFARTYRFFPAPNDDDYASLRPREAPVAEPPAGLGYFARLMRDVNFNHPGDAIDPAQPYDITLTASNDGTAWHIIGNPFPIAIPMDALRIIHQGNQLTLAQARNAGVVLSPLFAYLPPHDNPFDVGEYAILSGDAFPIEPFHAYWIAVGANVTLRFPALTDIVAKMQLRARNRLIAGKHNVSKQCSILQGHGWQLRLVAHAGGYSDGLLFIGMASNGRLGHDGLDSLKPPPAPNAPIRCYVLQRLPNGAYGQYAIAMHPISNRAIWDVIIETQPNATDALLQWQGIHNIPSRYRLTLMDVATGRYLSMRRYSSYTLRANASGSVGVHRVRIIAELRRHAHPSITGLRIVRLRGNAIGFQFTISSALTVRVHLRSLTGRIIDTVMPARMLEAGTHVVVWHQRAKWRITSGVAFVEVIGEDDAGRIARIMRLVRLM